MGEVSMRVQADETFGRRGMGSDGTVETFREEVRKEIKNLKSSLQFRQVQEEQFNVSGADLCQEREERQMEDRSLHLLLDNLTEQINHIFDETRTGWEEESQRLWEALHTHTHDIHLRNPDGTVSHDTYSLRSMVHSVGPSAPAPGKLGGGMPMHHHPLAGKNNSLNASPAPSGTERPLIPGSYLDHISQSRRNP